MDTAGAEVLRQVLALLTERNITFAISRASGPLRSVLDDYGLMDEIGRDRFYETNRDAAAEFRHESSST